MVKIHSYFSHYKKRTLALILLVQAIAIGAAWAVGYWTSQNGYGALMPLYFLAAAMLATPLIVMIVSKPFGKLTKAVAHVSKDPVVTAPPALTQADEQSGLKALVQTVYELAVAAPQKSDKTGGQGLFRELAQKLPCGVIVIGADGTIAYANSQAPITTAPGGKTVVTLNFDQTDTLTTWLQDCRANKVHESRQWVRVADKLPGEVDRRIFDVAAYYQKEASSNVETVVVTFDRTNIYQRDQEDMDFIALAAHELRGPITVIRGYLDVFNEELTAKLDEEQRQLLERLEVSAERLASYVNNILNVSRYDRHQFTLHMQQEQLSTIVEGVVPDLNLRAKTQGRTLRFDIPQGLPTVAADRSTIGEVITNLVDNAIKYSQPGGEVILRASAKDNQVEVTVQDYGIGIPASVIGNLFNRFYRSHHSNKIVGGTGLGLYICKAIIEMHGGTIWARSAEGQGTTFGFTLATYQSVADKLQNGNNINSDIVQRPEGWIKNHAMVRR